MINTIFRKFGVFVIIFQLLFTGFTQSAYAGLIGTDAAIELQSDKQRSSVDAFLARADVQAQMMQLGVSPADAQIRVAQLTERELQVLEGQINDLPAGGSFLAVVGAVFVVLIILELVGIINIFQKF